MRRAGPRKVLFGSDGPFLHPGVELAKAQALPVDAAGWRDVLGRQRAAADRTRAAAVPGPSTSRAGGAARGMTAAWRPRRARRARRRRAVSRPAARRAVPRPPRPPRARLGRAPLEPARSPGSSSAAGLDVEPAGPRPADSVPRDARHQRSAGRAVLRVRRPPGARPRLRAQRGAQPRRPGRRRALAPLRRRRGGRVVALGTPAEEGGGGKIELLRRRAFDGAAAALLAHPGPTTRSARRSAPRPRPRSLFRGRAAHAAMAPGSGRNALDAAVLAYQAIAAARSGLATASRSRPCWSVAARRPTWCRRSPSCG